MGTGFLQRTGSIVCLGYFILQAGWIPCWTLYILSYSSSNKSLRRNTRRLFHLQSKGRQNHSTLPNGRQFVDIYPIDCFSCPILFSSYFEDILASNRISETFAYHIAFYPRIVHIPSSTSFHYRL